MPIGAHVVPYMLRIVLSIGKTLITGLRNKLIVPILYYIVCNDPVYTGLNSVCVHWKLTKKREHSNLFRSRKH